MSAEREALFDPQVHYGVRVVTGGVALGMLLVALRLGWLALADRRWAPFGALPIAGVFLALVYFSVFQTEPLYATAEGLQVRSGQGWATVPWSEVGAPERAWWSFNPVFRVMEVPVAGREPVRVFASRRTLRRLDQLRAGAPGGDDTP